MFAESEERFTLRKITDTEWLLIDERYSSHDPLHTIACIRDTGAVCVDVVWLREVPLATEFLTPFDVLDEVRRLHRADRGRRPSPIPHFPPPMH